MSEPSNINRGDQICTIGLDVGGTKMAGCVTTRDGKVHLQSKMLTRADRGGQAVAADALKLVKDLDSQARRLALQPQALGIGICELVDLSGNVASECTITWRDEAIWRQFEDFLPTAVEADSRAAALAEARYGVGQDSPIFFYVTVGTGIGSGLVIDGKPYKGARGSTGTMATGSLSTLCSQCGAVSQSNLERIASGTAIGRRYAELTGSPETSAEMVLAAAGQGDQLARQVLDTGATCLGSMISQLVNVLDPHAVVVGGGLGSAPGYYWERLVETIRREIWSDTHRMLPIVQGRLGEFASATGAALHAAEHFDVYS